MQPVVTGLLVLLLIAFAMYRRMRPQPVQPRRAVVMSAVIVMLSLLSLIGTNHVTANPLALALALPALVIGFGGGLFLMRSIHFWRDTSTGVLWMKGGVVYLVAWFATVVLRQVVAYADGAYSAQSLSGHPTTLNPTLSALSADLVIVSMGIWIARAVALVRRSHVTSAHTVVDQSAES